MEYLKQIVVACLSIETPGRLQSLLVVGQGRTMAASVPTILV